ncbi:MAG: FtsX-like permease family protein [Thermodesulforhabdaceae bacterium]
MILRILLFLFVLLLESSTLYAVSVKTSEDIRFFSSLKDRSAGSPESLEVADYIAKEFKEAGLKDVDFLDFDHPVPRIKEAFMEVFSYRIPLRLLQPNLVVFSVTSSDGTGGDLVYAGKGEWWEINGKDIKGAIVLCEMDSSPDFWLHAAALGAKALIYLGSEGDYSKVYLEKLTKTPISFPRFWVSPDDAAWLRTLLGSGQKLHARLSSSAQWERAILRNVYGVVPGTDKKLSKELVVIEAPYDASGLVLGESPAMDEATSIMVFLNLARSLAHNPPKRSVMFIATAGKNEALAGARVVAWEMSASKKERKKELGQLSKSLDTVKAQLEAINLFLASRELNDEIDRLIHPLVISKSKDLIDDLVNIRKNLDEVDEESSRGFCKSPGDEKCSKEGMEKKLLALRTLSARPSLKGLQESESRLVRRLIKDIRTDLRNARSELSLRLLTRKSGEKFRKLIDSYDVVLSLSLNLSSFDPFLEFKQQGALFPLKDEVAKRNRISSLVNFVSTVSSSISSEKRIPNLMTSARKEPGGSSFSFKILNVAQQPLSSDVLSIAGFPAAAITSRYGVSPFWGTPSDSLERWNAVNFFLISDFLEHLMPRIINEDVLKGLVKPGVKGLAILDGSTMFVRRGELFPDRPASGTLVSIIQGDTVFRAMSYHDGSFSIPGVANKKVSHYKLIIEPYGLSGDSGTITWAANKRILKKDSYRLQIPAKRGFTTLVMFPCVQTDIVDVFKPQKLSHITKVTLIDAVTETMPSSFWYSRMDGRDTFALSVFLEQNRRFKLLLADSIVGRDVLFINADSKKPEGRGFVAGQSIIDPLQSALDMKELVGTRLSYLRDHGVIDQPLEELYHQGGELTESTKSELDVRRYDRFWEFLVRGWAQLSAAYNAIDRTQRDILAGVMFFIVLAVPFAYCLERFLFCFVSVYHQIAGFLGILFITVAIIGWLNPAFALTYSPVMVVVAFLIMSLSVVVIWIIFTRFEQEIAIVRRALAGYGKTGPVSSASIGHIQWGQAIAIAFGIGTSNLHRRPLRTVLTCLTIVLLTFTVMSFTSVKSFEKPTHIETGRKANYTGITIHHPFWFSFNDEAWRTIRTIFSEGAIFMPRAWVDPKNTAGMVIRANPFGKNAEIEGLLGLSHHVPSSLADVVVEGRWLAPAATNEILIPSSLAKSLGISLRDVSVSDVTIRGITFVVVGIFNEERLEKWHDLNGLPVLPRFLEQGAEELREVEVEALETGLELLPVISRFQATSPSRTVIIPYETCIKLGGELKAISVEMPGGDPVKVAESLPFSGAFSIFAGVEGKEALEITSAAVLRYQGLTDVFVPIITVIAICFNTLIGHVQERRREIAVYTSVGLAPRHVGMLFIVEALSLAVLSSITGYIVAQLVAKYGRGLPLFADLSFNYSSLASIASIGLIFVAIFLASLYPVRMATRMAMPDVEKSWTLPEPQGDVLSIDLPFLFPAKDQDGIIRFLGNFMEEHQEADAGVFMSDSVDLTWADEKELFYGVDDKFMPVGRCLMIQTSVWLAPFDFGIQQRVRIYCCPASLGNYGGNLSPEEAKMLDELESSYVQVHIRMERIAGEATSWYRANSNFVKSLRKAILSWHALTEDEKSVYCYRSQPPS